MPVLELKKILHSKKPIETPMDEMRVMENLTKKVVEDLPGLLGLSKKDFVVLLPVSAKTVERLKDGIIEDLSLAEHLLHLAKIAKEGMDVFEDSKILAEWFKKPHPYLNGLEPYEVLRTITGCNIVVNLLGRAKHGIVG